MHAGADGHTSEAQRADPPPVTPSCIIMCCAAAKKAPVEKSGAAKEKPAAKKASGPRKKAPSTKKKVAPKVRLLPSALLFELRLRAPRRCLSIVRFHVSASAASLRPHRPRSRRRAPSRPEEDPGFLSRAQTQALTSARVFANTAAALSRPAGSTNRWPVSRTAGSSNSR